MSIEILERRPDAEPVARGLDAVHPLAQRECRAEYVRVRDERGRRWWVWRATWGT